MTERTKTYRTVPLDIAKSAGRIRRTAEEREASILALIAEVHPRLADIKREERLVQAALGDPGDRDRINKYRNSRKAKERAKADKRMAEVLARKRGGE